MEYYIKFKNGSDLLVWCPEIDDVFTSDILRENCIVTIAGHMDGRDDVSQIMFHTTEILYISQTKMENSDG